MAQSGEEGNGQVRGFASGVADGELHEGGVGVGSERVLVIMYAAACVSGSLAARSPERREGRRTRRKGSTVGAERASTDTATQRVMATRGASGRAAASQMNLRTDGSAVQAAARTAFESGEPDALQARRNCHLPTGSTRWISRTNCGLVWYGRQHSSSCSTLWVWTWYLRANRLLASR